MLGSVEKPADFDGPLSLILTLLSKNKIEIRDVRISDILDQYLAWLAEMESLDLEVASEFVQMASYLLYIKAKTVLEGEEQVSEMQELMDSLEQLKCRDLRESLKTVAPILSQASERGFLLYTRGQEPLPPRSGTYEYRHEPPELMEALYAVFSRSGARAPGPPELRSLAPSRIVYGVRDKCREILSRLKNGGSVTLRALYGESRSRSEIVATFISVLELCAMGGLQVDGAGEDFVLTSAGGDAEKLLSAIEE